MAKITTVVFPLREKLSSLGRTQVELSLALGVHVQTVQKWCRAGRCSRKARRLVLRWESEMEQPDPGLAESDENRYEYKRYGTAEVFDGEKWRSPETSEELAFIGRLNRSLEAAMRPLPLCQKCRTRHVGKCKVRTVADMRGF